MDTIHYLTQEKLKALLKQLTSKRDKALILLAYSYGLRASEVGLLRREDIDFDRLKIRTRGCHFHVLKHSTATHLLDAGADIMFVKEWLGHKNIQNTIVYSQLASRTRDEKARKIFASPRIV